MATMKTRFFVQAAGCEITPEYLEVDWPERFHGFPGKPLASDHAPVYQAVARFPRVLDAEEFTSRHGSDLEALVQLLVSVKQFWKDFEKTGGKIYASMGDNEDVADLSEPLKAKDFFW